MDRSRANLEEYERVLRLAAARQREAAGGDYSVGAPPLSRVSADVLLNLERRSEELSRRARHFSSVGTSDPASAGPPTRVLRDRHVGRRARLPGGGAGAGSRKRGREVGEQHENSPHS